MISGVFFEQEADSGNTGDRACQNGEGHLEPANCPEVLPEGADILGMNNIKCIPPVINMKTVYNDPDHGNDNTDYEQKDAACFVLRHGYQPP